jgi:hypothetical protein
MDDDENLDSELTPQKESKMESSNYYKKEVRNIEKNPELYEAHFFQNYHVQHKSCNGIYCILKPTTPSRKN